MSNRAEQLKNEGRRTAHGTLMVDQGHAREKLRKFRLANPHYYVLQFVRMASLLGASRIEFRIDADSVECQCDAALPYDHLAEIWSRAYDEREDEVDEATYQLALGIGSAQALSPAVISVTTSDRGGLARRLSAEGDQLEERPGISHPSTRIRLREKFRLGHLAEFFTARFGVLEEVRVLREYCSFAAIDVVVNEELANPPFLTHQLVSHRDTERTSASVALSRDIPCQQRQRLPQTSGIRAVLVKEGVRIGHFRDDEHLLPAVGRLESSELHTDLSSLAVVEDDAYDRVVHRELFGCYHNALRHHLVQVRRDLISRRDQSSLRELRELLATLMRWMLQVRNAGVRPAKESELLLDYLRKQALFERADGPGGYVTYDDLIHDGPLREQVRYSDTRFPDIEPEHGIPIALAESNSNVLTTLRSIEKSGGPLSKNGVLELLQARRKITNKTRWEAREPVAEFPDVPEYLDVAVEGGRARIFAVLKRGKAPTSDVEIRIDGRPIRHARTSQTPFSFLLDGKFEPNEAYDNVVGGPLLRELALRMVTGIPELMGRLASNQVASDDSAVGRVTEILRWYVIHMIRGDVAHLVLEQLRFPSDEIAALLSHQGLGPYRDELGLVWTDSTPPKRILEGLGPLTDVDLFEDAFGRRRSLAELATANTITLVRSPDEADHAASFTFVTDHGHQDELLERLFDVHRAGRLARRRADEPSRATEESSVLPDESDREIEGSSLTSFDDPLLERLSQLLLELRGDREDLLDDTLAASFRLSNLPGQLCQVTDGDVLLNPTHPIVDAVLEDERMLGVLASVVYSEINRHYQRISDHDDLEMQRRLLARAVR